MNLPDGLQQPETGEQLRTTAQVHMALMTDEALSVYFGAALGQLALRYDKTPDVVLDEMKAAGLADDWPTARERLRKLSDNARKMYAQAGVYLAAKRPQG